MTSTDSLLINEKIQLTIDYLDRYLDRIDIIQNKIIQINDLVVKNINLENILKNITEEISWYSKFMSKKSRYQKKSAPVNINQYLICKQKELHSLLKELHPLCAECVDIVSHLNYKIFPMLDMLISSFEELHSKILHIYDALYKCNGSFLNFKMCVSIAMKEPI